MGRKSHAQIIRDRFLENHNIVERYILPGHENDKDVEDFNLGPCFIHKTNDSFMAINDDDSLKKDWKFIITYGIDKDIHYNHGFASSTQEWYGWTHRAIYSFGIGSKVTKGSIGYVPYDVEDFNNHAKDFWEDKWDDVERIVTGFKDNVTNPDGLEDLGCMVYTTTRYFGKQTGRESTRDEFFMMYPPVWGRGEWEATTLEEAKIMALDFAKGAS